jgi:hypothetical protein
VPFPEKKYLLVAREDDTFDIEEYVPPTPVEGYVNAIAFNNHHS